MWLGGDEKYKTNIYSTLCELKKKFHPHPTTLNRNKGKHISSEGVWVGGETFFKVHKGWNIYWFYVKRLV